MSDLMLDVDQVGELKAAFIRGDWSNGEIKKLSSGDLLERVRKVVMGEAKIVPIEHFPVSGHLLTQTSMTIDLPKREKEFIVAKEFVRGKAGIVFIDSFFTSRFGTKIEEPSKGRQLTAHTINHSASVADMAKELGDRSETTLTDVWSLMDQQSKGQGGILLVSGWGNIFKCTDVEGNELAVHVLWQANAGGWGVFCSALTLTWLDVRRFLSSN